MNQEIRNKLRSVVLQARHLLETAIAQHWEARFTLFVRNNKLTADPKANVAHLDEQEKALRREILDHLHHLSAQKTPGVDTFYQLIREVAFTWLNRFVAFKMFESRKLLRETIARWDNSDGFKRWLAEDVNQDALADYERGDFPANAQGEGPRSHAYRRFLLAQCGQLAREIRVLFDPNNLVSRLAPPLRTLKQLTELLNDPDMAPAWQTGNEETLGWMYQDFTSEELETAFREMRTAKKKFDAKDIPAVTQLFTQRWIVRYLVHNTLGRLWLEMHPDSSLSDQFDYLVPTEPTDHLPSLKSVRGIRLLDPACGTMHFGLVAFDLFALMYQEESKRAGQPGWPEKPPVASLDNIPAAIIAHNIHGIDIDPRAVQIAALALYLKAKAFAPKAALTESRLACANVHIHGGEQLGQFLKQSGLDKRPIYHRILQALEEELQQSEQLGSLLPLEHRIKTLVEQERQNYQKEGKQPDLFGWSHQQFETEAGQQEFWEILEVQIGQALDAFARQQAEAGSHQTFFASETVKGLRLLELMTQTYDVVVTNPPYMSARKMNASLKGLVARYYPEGKGDLYAAFLLRCLQLTGNTGRIGMLTMHSFLFISSYEKLRNKISEQATTDTLLHTGPALFDVGNPGTLQTAAYVLRRETDAKRRNDAVGTYFRLVKEPNAEAKRARFELALAQLRSTGSDPCVYRYRQADFAAIPGKPWVYWITPNLRRLFETLQKLRDVAEPKVGLQTGENFRFLRFWWEVGKNRIAFGCQDANEAEASGNRWFPYMKGGAFRRWYGNQEYVVNWEYNGAEIRNFGADSGRIASRPQNISYYFRRGITVPKVSSGKFSARLSPEGFIFADATSGIFPQNRHLILGLMNSGIFQYFLHLINPTVNSQVGDLARLPIPDHSSQLLEQLVEQAIALAKCDSVEDETTWDFVAPPAWPDGLEIVQQRHQQLIQIEQKIDEEVYRLYGISESDRRAIEAELAEGTTVEDDETDDEATNGDAGDTSDKDSLSNDQTHLAKRWLQYAFGIVMGQFSANEITQQQVPTNGLVPVDPYEPNDIANRVLFVLESLLGQKDAMSVVHKSFGTGDPRTALRNHLTSAFFKHHTQQYCKRPIYWYLSSSRGNYGLWLYALRLDKDTLFKALNTCVEPKIRLETNRLAGMRSQRQTTGNTGRAAQRLASDIEQQESFLSELQDFEDKLRRVADLGLEPDLNDGVVLNIAPLHELVPWKEAKKYWDALLKGEHEWSSIGKQLREKGLVPC